jgi:hypothetical protein
MPIDLVGDAIRLHGAQRVHAAACAQLSGDPEPLRQVGLIVSNMGQAYAIMSQAFDGLSPSERASDYWRAMKGLPK